MHAGQHLAIAVRRYLAGPRSCLQHIDLTRAGLLLTQEFEIEGAYQLANQQMVAAAAILIDGYPRILLQLSFIPPLRNGPRKFVLLVRAQSRSQGFAIDSD